MQPLSSQEARQRFIDFFEAREHKHWPSSSVVPHNDPTLLFINAGMCQYKPIFLGDIDKSTEFGRLKRACNTQKCIRAGGKHNDLDDVGKDVYHHTFFEMLGNWSFGDYFKKEAIAFAWDLLTEGYKLPKERLYATYFGGDEKLGLPADTEAQEFWLQKLPASHVLPGSAKENFWEMGDTGPCGPCSELHFDRIGGRECPELVNQDDPDVLEIWNLVFMQFNREPSGKLTKLPAGCIDTGMGLERLVSVLNNVRSNYDTDFFQPLFKKIQEICPAVPREYQGKVGAEDPDRVDLAYRAVADHARTVTIAISDGAAPSNEGRGYVIRRVLRRAVRYGRQVLNAPKTEPWFYKLVPVVVQSLQCAFSDLKRNQERIMELVKDEEIQFGRTLDRGTTLFSRAIRRVDQGGKLDGKIGFELLATYGFPLDLTKLLCEENGIELDEPGFQAAMAEHHKNSEGGANRALVQMLKPDQVAQLEKEMKVEPTDDAFKYVWDTTGSGPEHVTTVRAIFDGEHFVDRVEASDKVVTVVLASTSFYAESGGQVGDTGFGTSADGKAEVTVVDTKRMGPFVLHMTKVVDGELGVGDQITLNCDYGRRAQSAKNHTGTHVLNFVLRRLLGDGVDQAGSIVEPARLRFDFSANQALTVDQLERIEADMAAIIAKKQPVFTEEAALARAKTIPGLRSVFGEHYPDPVRVVSVGCSLNDVLAGKQGASGDVTSIEFCGGTHISNTGEMESFTILGEESISRGVRRVVAATGEVAREALDLGQRLLEQAEAAEKLELAKAVAAMTEIREEVNAKKDSIPLVARKAVTVVLDKIAARKLEEGKQRAKLLKKEGADLGAAAAELVGDKKFAVFVQNSLCGDFKAMEEFVSAFSKTRSLPLLLLSGEPNAPCSILVSVPKQCVVQVQAANWGREALSGLDGKCGGKDVTARGTTSADAPLVQRQAEAYAATIFM